jgi:carbamoyl-phosphate synthase large subunit
VLDEIREQARRIALALEVKGLMNVQFAVQHTPDAPEGRVYVLEVNPRASRTVPFVSKATGVPLARAAALVMVGKSLREQGILAEPKVRYYSVKEAVLPFIKFSGVDPLLGPEMRSTGEVMGISADFGIAFGKTQAAAGSALPAPPEEGETRSVFVSVNNRHKHHLVPVAKRLADMGFELVATEGTGERLASDGIRAELVYKVHEGRPNIVDRIKNGDIHLVINTPLGAASKFDEAAIRRATIEKGVPYVTTLAAARAAVEAIESIHAKRVLEVRPLQDWHALNEAGA